MFSCGFPFFKSFSLSAEVGTLKNQQGKRIKKQNFFPKTFFFTFYVKGARYVRVCFSCDMKGDIYAFAYFLLFIIYKTGPG